MAGPAPPKRLVTSLVSDAVFAPGCRLHATVSMTADAIKWQQEAQSRKLRADNLQLIAQVEQLKSITGPLQHLSIEQIITSGNIDTVTGRSQVSADLSMECVGHIIFLRIGQ